MEHHVTWSSPSKLLQVIMIGMFCTVITSCKSVQFLRSKRKYANTQGYKHIIQPAQIKL